MSSHGGIALHPRPVELELPGRRVVSARCVLLAGPRVGSAPSGSLEPAVTLESHYRFALKVLFDEQGFSSLVENPDGHPKKPIGV